MISFVVKGAKELAEKYGKLKNEFPQAMEDATAEAIVTVHAEVPPYPPARPSSTYRRTGMLGRSVVTWQNENVDALSRVEVGFGQFKGYIGSRLSYSPYVIEEGSQASQHRGRWWTLQSVVRGAQTKILRVYASALRRLFGI